MTCVCTALVLAKKISIIDDYFIYYRSNQNNNLTANRYKNYDAVEKAVAKLKENLMLFGLYETFKKAYDFQAEASLRCGKVKPRKKNKYF